MLRYLQECSNLKYAQPITAIFYTCHDNVTVVTCAKILLWSIENISNQSITNFGTNFVGPAPADSRPAYTGRALVGLNFSLFQTVTMSVNNRPIVYERFNRTKRNIFVELHEKSYYLPPQSIHPVKYISPNVTHNQLAHNIMCTAMEQVNARYMVHGPVLQYAYQLIVDNSVRSNTYSSYPIGSQFCTCHGSLAVVTCAKLRADWKLIRNICKIWIISYYTLCEIDLRTIVYKQKSNRNDFLGNSSRNQ